MKFPNMFSPVQIGTVTVPNRFVVPPMGNDLANTDGSLSERSLSYYQARAKGGFGLITIESTVEKDSELGGNFRIASCPTGKGQISEAIRSMIVRAKQAGVNIRLNTETMEIQYGSNGMPDVGADGMYYNAGRKGSIETMPDTPGLAVWKSGHIGVYIGSGEVIEAMDTRYGVVKTKLQGRGWSHWLEVPGIKYD